MGARIAGLCGDGGFEQARNFILELFQDTIQKAAEGLLHSDYKTEVQEFLQSRGESEIQYFIEKEEGPDHDKLFYTILQAGGVEIGRGAGRSKKESEQKAAQDALVQLKR